MDESKLPSANENPWYILMTLYGEQPKVRFNWKRHELNSNAWNSFVWLNIDDEQRRQALEEKPDCFDQGELLSQNELEVLFEKRTKNETSAEFPCPSEGVKLSKLHFENLFTMKDFLLPWKFSVSNCLFSSRVNIENALFSQNVRIVGVTVKQNTSLRSSQFQERFLASNSCFSGAFEAVFAKFQISEFSDSVFEGEVNFYHAEFGKLVKIEDNVFHKRFDFFETYYASACEVSRTVFKEHVEFGGAIFEREKYELFGEEGYQSGIDFYQVDFRSSLSFQFSEFRYSYPTFDNTRIPDHTVFTVERTQWPLEVEQSAETARNSCSSIRHCFSKQGLSEEEHFFFRREMHFSGQIGSMFARLPYKIFGVFSDYGYSIARPVRYLAFLFLAPLGLYFAALGGDNALAAANAAGLSVSSVFKFFGFQRLYFGTEFMASAHWSLKLSTAVQTVFGYALLFFLGLGLRTRFRLR